MTISPREKMIAIGLGVVVGLYVLDQMLLAPMFDRLNVADGHIAADQITLQQSNATVQNGQMALKRWGDMSRGHIGLDASAAQSKLLNHVGDVARSAGLNLTSLKPEHGEKTMGFARAGLRATAATTMSTLAAFLQRLQSADLPVRVTDLQIKANKEGLDDLTVDVGISTIYQLPAAEAVK